MNNEITPYYDFSAIENSNLSETTKNQYRKALRNYLNTGNKLTDISALEQYALGLKPSSRAFLKAAIRLVTAKLENDLKGNVTPKTLPHVQSALYRIEAMNNTIKVKQPKGQKIHSWLSAKQVHEIMATCDTASLLGLRDWIALGLLLGAGLRREEATLVKFSDLVDLPMPKNGIRKCLNVTGKGGKSRVIPLNKALSAKLQEWYKLVGDNGFILRSIDKSGRVGDSLSPIGLFEIVRKHGKMIGVDNLDPHDLRRSFAQIGFDSGVPITQLSNQLGHSSIKTTQKYLNLDTDFLTNVSDFIPL